MQIGVKPLLRPLYVHVAVSTHVRKPWASRRADRRVLQDAGGREVDQDLEDDEGRQVLPLLPRVHRDAPPPAAQRLISFPENPKFSPKYDFHN